MESISSTVFSFYLDIDERYKDLFKQAIHVATIFLVMIFLCDSCKSPSIFDIFVCVFMGELFYTLVVKYLIKIY